MMAMMMWDRVPTSTRGRAITRSPCRSGAGARVSAAKSARRRAGKGTRRRRRDVRFSVRIGLTSFRMQLVREMANPTEIGRETRVVALCAAILVAGMLPSSRGSIAAPGASQRAAKPWCRKDSRATGILVEEARRRWDRV